MKSSYDVKRILKNFKIFAVLAVVLAVFTVVFYTNLFAKTQNEEKTVFESKLDVYFSALEKEINVQKAVVQNISETEAFNALVNGSGDSVALAEVASAFSVADVFSSNSRAFLIFKKSGIYIDENGVSKTLKSSYGNAWTLSVNNDKFYIDYAVGQFFMRNHGGGIEGVYKFLDIMQSKEYALVSMQSLAMTGEETSDAVHVVCYDAEEFLKDVGISKYLSSYSLTANGGTISSLSEKSNVKYYDYCYEYPSLGIKLYYDMSGKYVFSNLTEVNIFLAFLMFLLLAAGAVITVGISAYENKRIKAVLDCVGDIEKTGFESSGDMYNSIGYVYKNLHGKLFENDEKIKELTVMRMLSFGLDFDGYEKMGEWIEFPCLMVVLKNYSQKHRNYKMSMGEFFNERDINVIFNVDVSETESVLFMPLGAEFVIGEIPLFVNQKCRADVRGVYVRVQSPERVSEFYKKMKNTIRYLEYGRMQQAVFGEEESSNRAAVMGNLVSSGRQLYELIRSGNVFEAKRSVYEQWYGLSLEFGENDGIEQLFYCQTSIISQLSADLSINIKLPEFDSTKDVVTLAFEITECIDMLSSNIKERGNSKNSVKGNQIADYIKQRYTDSSFYMPELVGRFSMSDRAIVRLLKSQTGKNFSDYVGELRVKHAEQLLSDTSLTVADIAAKSGFDSSNSLYKAFKKCFGVSPSAYRSSRVKKQIEETE